MHWKKRLLLRVLIKCCFFNVWCVCVTLEITASKQPIVVCLLYTVNFHNKQVPCFVVIVAVTVFLIIDRMS